VSVLRLTSTKVGTPPRSRNKWSIDHLLGPPSSEAIACSSTRVGAVHLIAREQGGEARQQVLIF